MAFEFCLSYPFAKAFLALLGPGLVGNPAKSEVPEGSFEEVVCGNSAGRPRIRSDGGNAV